jgi:hypothetical protein
MPKRTFWTTVGYGLGIGSSIYVQRRVRRTVDRFAPAEVRREVTTKGAAVAATGAETAKAALDLARAKSTDVVAALKEGRETMRAEETALRQEYGLPPRRRAG